MATSAEEGTGTCSVCKAIEKERKEVDSQPHSFSYHVDLSIFQRSLCRNKTKCKRKDKDKNQNKEKDEKKVKETDNHNGDDKDKGDAKDKDTDKEAHRTRIKEKKKKTIQDLENIVSGLLNTLGGSIVVHLDGHQQGDLYLGHFDDFIGNRFRELIQNGELYVNVYKRRWIKQDFVLITVTKSDSVSTVDFNTKVNTDFENTNPTLCNIQTILKRKGKSEIVRPSVRGIGEDLQELHECRSIQLKCYIPKEKVKQGDSNYVIQVVNFVWDDLKFKHNLTSMSKVEGGGSFYVGIEEKDTTKTYDRKIPDVTGFDLPCSHRAHFTECFLGKFQETVTALDLNGSFIDDVSSLSLIELRFHDYNGLCVLEIAVRFFDGILFYDKKGPRAYIIKDDEICRMDREEWLQKVKPVPQTE